MSTSSCDLCNKLDRLRELPKGEVLWQFAHSVALLGPWQFYQGYCILVSRSHATELSELPDDERRAYFEEMCVLARAIEEAYHPDKLNYEILGNQVPHLHWHLFPRSRKDPNFRKPVWLAIERAEKDRAEKLDLQTAPASRLDIMETLRASLQKLAPRGSFRSAVASGSGDAPNRKSNPKKAEDEDGDFQADDPADFGEDYGGGGGDFGSDEKKEDAGGGGDFGTKEDDAGGGGDFGSEEDDPKKKKKEEDAGGGGDFGSEEDDPKKKKNGGGGGDF
jgi:diadenosine tetraphosphate (Ap4A) HIT family hydrolase